ncbi:MAG: hypothetical protein ACLSE6_00545 [Alphaproteobacteria bacterium]
MEKAIRRLSGGGKQFETGCRSADGCHQEESFAKEQKPFKLRFAEVVRLYSGKV